ncbi:VOC family protein [Fischerella sp. PCC 9605]|uniref:VOC family protein n=1 Tax=Fischerella sp. PCC 9605 TaxID=1173024 RepID=UPI00047BDE47|nr:VOC family protein [Fischerella sp. PCC 9605]
MSNHHLTNSAIGDNTTNFSKTKRSPFIETNGLLFYKQECKTPEFLNSSAVITLFGEAVVVDHYVLLFPDPDTLIDYANALVNYGAKITEGPGTFPENFCTDRKILPEDLWIFYLSSLIPSGVIVSLAAPHAPNDDLDRLLKKYGDNAVHHVAIRVDDIYAAAEVWQKKGFIPLSRNPQDDGCLCQWFLRNWAGQIVELIHRRSEGRQTFSCENIAGLRLCETTRL